MFSFDELFFGEKKIFVLLFPECIDNLLSINHSQSDENYVSRLFLFFFQHPWKKMQVLSTERYDPVSLNASGKPFIYIRKMSGSKNYPI